MFSLFKTVFGRKQPLDAVSESSTASEISAQEEGGDLSSRPTEVVERSANASSQVIEIPLNEIIERLPECLRAQVAKPPGRFAVLSLPRSLALRQLPTGKVSVRFEDCKKYSPPGVFLSAKTFDSEMVDLPLRTIIACLHPEHMPRRTGQRAVYVPSEVTSPFNEKGALRGLALAKGDDERPSRRVVSSPALPKPTSARFEPASPEQIVPFRLPAKPADASLQAHGQSVESERSLEEALAANHHRPDDGCVVVDAAKVAANWPEKLHTLFSKLSADSSIRIPSSEIEASLKRGKVAFTWKQVRSWIIPEMKNAVPEYDAMLLEFPLAEVVPMFLEQKNGRIAPRKSTTVESIPDLFSPFGQVNLNDGGIAEVDPPSIGAEHTSRRKENGFLPFQKLPTNGKATFETQRQLANSPADVVERTCALAGVSGALWATSDGLLVAGRMPSDLSSETFAAFVPQLYQRVTQYSREMRIGEPDQLALVAEGRPWMVLKVNETYFTILGCVGESLPEASIRAVTAELRRSTSRV